MIGLHPCREKPSFRARATIVFYLKGQEWRRYSLKLKGHYIASVSCEPAELALGELSAPSQNGEAIARLPPVSRFASHK